MTRFRMLPTCLFIISSTLITLPFAQVAVAAGEKDARPQDVSSCQLDLNNDQQEDIALLVPTSAGWDLIVLLNTNEGYDTFVVSQRNPRMELSCHFGSTLRETSAGPGRRRGRTYHTNGTYLLLAQPEGAKVAYFWKGSSFQEVWTAD